MIADTIALPVAGLLTGFLFIAGHALAMTKGLATVRQAGVDRDRRLDDHGDELESLDVRMRNVEIEASTNTLHRSAYEEMRRSHLRASMQEPPPLTRDPKRRIR